MGLLDWICAEAARRGHRVRPATSEARNGVADSPCALQIEADRPTHFGCVTRAMRGVAPCRVMLVFAPLPCWRCRWVCWISWPRSLQVKMKLRVAQQNGHGVLPQNLIAVMPAGCSREGFAMSHACLGEFPFATGIALLRAQAFEQEVRAHGWLTDEYAKASFIQGCRQQACALCVPCSHGGEPRPICMDGMATEGCNC